MVFTVGETVYSNRGQGVVISSNGRGWYDIRSNGVIHKVRRTQLSEGPLRNRLEEAVEEAVELPVELSLESLIDLAIRRERESKELEDTLYESVVRNSLDVPEENEKFMC